MAVGLLFDHPNSRIYNRRSILQLIVGEHFKEVFAVVTVPHQKDRLCRRCSSISICRSMPSRRLNDRCDVTARNTSPSRARGGM